MHAAAAGPTLRRVAIGALIVSLGVGIASGLLFLAAFQLRIDWFLEPTRILGAGEASAVLLRWAAVLDLIGYYLATGVLAYALWRMLRPGNPVIADLSALAAFGYTVAGGAAAAVLALVGPLLMQNHAATANPAEQAVIAGQFEVLFEVVFRSVWQLFDAILIGAWWLGIGLLLRRDQPIISGLSLAMAALALVGFFISVLGLDVVRDVGLGLVFALWTIWWLLLLLALLRKRPPFDEAPSTETVFSE